MHEKVDQRKYGGCDQKGTDIIGGSKMALKKLSQFQYFDIDEFLSKMKLITTGQAEWKDFETGNRKGTKVETVIAQDKTQYRTKEGEVVNNLYEKLNIKIMKEINVSMNIEVRLINPVATVYGEYRNQLSIMAEDIEVISK